MNSVKRRRIETNASTLSKPFRSPLKVNSPAQNPASKTTPSITDTQPSLPPSQIASKPPVSIDNTESVKSHNVVDHHVVPLQKEHAATKLELRKLRQDLNAVEQALKIHDARQEEKLDGLIFKWRTVARELADEVFTASSSCIKEMGGLRTWQNTSRGGYYENTEDNMDQQDQCFTMDLMLQQCGIEPDLLGYDTRTEQWARLD